MLSLFGLVDKTGFLFLVAFILLTIFLTFVNHYNITNLELRLMSNFKIIKIYSSVILLIGSIIVLMYLVSDYFTKGKNKIEEFSTNGEIITTIIVIYILLLVVSAFVTWMFVIFSFRNKFSILIEGDETPWNINKVTGKNGLLLSQEKNKFKIIKDYSNMIITKEMDSRDEWKIKFYKLNIRFYFIVITSILLLVVSCIYLFKDTDVSLLSFVMLLIYFITTSVLISIIVNYIQYRKSLK